MPARRRRLIGGILLAGLGMLLVADLLQLTRASGVAALACTPVYFREEPSVPDFLAGYRDEIVREAENLDLPAELIAAVIVNHQARLTSRDRYVDCIGSALGANVSLGLAQIRLSTAALLDGLPFGSMSASIYRSLRSRLLDPDQNIAYQARELRSLLDREHRYPGIGADDLIHSPAVMALLITEYRMGRLGTPSNNSRRSGAAFDALRWIEDGSVDIFGREAADTALIKAEIRGYLGFIYCESEIFNQTACEWWERSMTGQGGP